MNVANTTSCVGDANDCRGSRARGRGAEFAGIEVLTYTILSNHFHLLVRVPKRELLTDEELLRRYQVLYPKPTLYQPASVTALRGRMQFRGQTQNH